MNVWTQLGSDEQGWITERACQYGDGLFETVAAREGQPCLWHYHVDRLLAGCDRLALPRPDTAQLEAIVRKAAGEHDAIGLKLYWTAGRSARGYQRKLPLSAHGYLQTFPWRPPGERPPWQVRFCGHRLSENPHLAGIKHLNRLDQVLGRAEWDNDRFDEGLMFGQDGRLVCGTRSNIVLEMKGRLVTPVIDRAGVAGVVRRCLIEEARRQQVDLEIRPVNRDEIGMAEALYLTNTLIGVQRVRRCEDRLFDVDRPTPALLAHVDQLAFSASSASKAS